MQLTASMLHEACRDEGRDAGVSITTELEPIAGRGTPVKPAIYAGGKYQEDRRWWFGTAEPEPADVIVVDNVPSQANRLEAVLAAERSRLGLPEIVLDLSAFNLPSHLPDRISSFQFPHRNADAYLRDAMLERTKFPRTAIGRAVFEASATNPASLYEWLPQALLFGFWQSHLGKDKSQAKLARSWVSEIVGYFPASDGTTTLGLKGDPLNLSIDEAVEFDDNDVADWKVIESHKGGKGKERLSEIGHGQVPVDGSLAPVSFRAIRQEASLSFAGLRRISTGIDEQDAWGRALLAAIGLTAHTLAFGRGFSLRSGCDLRPVSSTITWRGEAGDTEIDALTATDAEDILRECASNAQSAGLRVGADWPEPLVVVPARNLEKAIRKTWPDGPDAEGS